VINGDDFYGRSALESIARYLESCPSDSTDYAMVGYRLDRTLSEHGTVSRGIVERDDDRWLRTIEEHTKLRPRSVGVESLADDGDVVRTFVGTEEASMNLFGFTPTVFAQFRVEFESFLNEKGGDPRSEFYIPYAVDRLISAGNARMKVLPTDSEWFGVTYKEDRAAVVSRIERLVSSGEYPSSLWKKSSGA
jgi:hypothetical protein